MVCGRRAFQNCMYQLWLTPTSQARIASSGSTAWQSATMRSGRIGEAWMSKFGLRERLPLRLPALDLGVPGASARRRAWRRGRSSSASSWRRKVRASARMPRSGG